MGISTKSFQVNGRDYRLPAQPVVVICLDGSADEYFTAALVAGRMPNLARLIVGGHRSVARAAMPTFTNVNNASIVTGVPPSVHGICGNFFFDSTSKSEVMMNSASFLRAETIFAGAVKAGRKVAVVTSKDKLRDIFAQGIVGQGGIAFSAEFADRTAVATHGIEKVVEMLGMPAPKIYSAEATLYVLKAGAEILRRKMADFLYLSTTDYMQHKYAPDAPESLDFYHQIDQQLGELMQGGAIIGLTADHGMNAKHHPDGSPKVIYLESELNDAFDHKFRVILPITDPYVAHHGALGSFAVVHVEPEDHLQEIRDWLFQIEGITEVYERDLAVRKLQLPGDRMGELVVVSGRDYVIGKTPQGHDLSQLVGALRSHGGRYEEMVPFILSHSLTKEYLAKSMGDPRNFDIFDFVLNGTTQS